MEKQIVIVDFGSQYTHLIARNIRELGVLAKIYHEEDLEIKKLPEFASGIILSGGPQSVYEKDSLKIDKEIFELEIPVLGICYGHQLMAHLLGGEVQKGTLGEYGKAELEIVEESTVFQEVPGETQVWMSHGDAVISAPKGFQVVGRTEDCKIVAMANERRKLFGLQFHPEVMHSLEGKKIIENFVLSVCAAKKNWGITQVEKETEEKIKKQVGDKKVFILISGGVDSNVSFAFLTKILEKERVKGLYIDTGFMREGESERIKKRFEEIGADNIDFVDAEKTFFKKLERIFDPEEKRKIIGQTFLDIKDDLIDKIGLNSEEWLLGQGTIYPDTIESGDSKNSQTIKTHHNRVDAIAKMIKEGLVIEPIVDLYKDEVRKLGKLLGLPDELVNRHPFPGPGLAIRCLCWEEDLGEDFEVVKKQIAPKVTEKVGGDNFEILSVKSVGVQGDGRTYAHPLVVWGEEDWEKLDEISLSVTNSMKEINRVVLLCGSRDEKKVFKTPSRDLWLTSERIKILREIDGIVNETIREENIYDQIDQFPVVLLPVCDDKGRESIVLRPINTRDFMTLSFYQMERSVLEKITGQIIKTGKVAHVFYDITNKPPGTTEWE
jgi:GMP synthase (glutamine-hydrolysing)